MAASSPLTDLEVEHFGGLTELIEAEPALRALARLGRVRLTTDGQFVAFARRFTLADRVVRRPAGFDPEERRSAISVVGLDGRPGQPQDLSEWFASTGATARRPQLDVDPADCPIPLPAKSVVIDLGRHAGDDAWPLTRWIRLAEDLTQAESHVVLIGRRDHRSDSREIVASVGANVTDMVGALDLAELPAIIARCGRLVSLDVSMQSLGRASGAHVVSVTTSDTSRSVFERLDAVPSDPVVVVCDVDPIDLPVTQVTTDAQFTPAEG